MAEKKNKRFIQKSYQLQFSIIVDTVTGVNYLETTTGVTPLLDSEGKVIVSSQEEMMMNRRDDENKGSMEKLRQAFGGK